MNNVEELQRRLAQGEEQLKRLEQIHTRRMYELEQAQKAEAECLAEAKQLGVNSLAELTDLVQAMEKEQAEEIERWEKGIRENARILQEVEQRIAQEEG